MNKRHLTISQAAQLLGVSTQTLRRWDEQGALDSHRRQKGGFRYYTEADFESVLEKGQLDVEKMARTWVKSDEFWEPLATLYCRLSNHFQLRLESLEKQLIHIPSIKNILSLITSVAGEIGNNSFDHNLGNWPDVPGVFFGFDTKRKKILLGDRGQGILKTLSRVRPNLQTHTQALEVAFTEVVTGRAPEHRGNGLKFVRQIIERHPLSLTYQTGNAYLQLQHKDTELNITEADNTINGCLAVISF